jgi:branched-chain amino acid transport system ATP-binding protein
MTLLLVRGLTAGRNGVPAVRKFDLELQSGEVVALLGPNGAGKTTLLETIGGVLLSLGGSVTVAGSDIRDLRAAASCGVSYLREGRGLFTQLTVDENLRLRTRSRSAAQATRRQYPLLDALADRRVGLLSGGEQQLLALACALAVQPRILLIDEMTMGLAPIVVSLLLQAVRTAADAGVAVLFVDQHVSAALAFADRALVLRHGEIVLQGRASELSDRLAELQDSYFDLAGSPTLPPA